MRVRYNKTISVHYRGTISLNSFRSDGSLPATSHAPIKLLPLTTHFNYSSVTRSVFGAALASISIFRKLSNQILIGLKRVEREKEIESHRSRGFEPPQGSQHLRAKTETKPSHLTIFNPSYPELEEKGQGIWAEFQRSKELRIGMEGTKREGKKHCQVDCGCTATEISCSCV